MSSRTTDDSMGKCEHNSYVFLAVIPKRNIVTLKKKLFECRCNFICNFRSSLLIRISFNRYLSQMISI